MIGLLVLGDVITLLVFGDLQNLFIDIGIPPSEYSCTRINGG